MSRNNMPNKLLKKSVLFLFLFLWPLINISAEENDAIGIRIIPNPENLSISRWYAAQGFSGSPQLITVDSYPAIRDGRTVYVNFANIKDNNLYTDILLISYNQDSSIPTVDIFGQIIKNMNFNNNINDSGFCSLTTERACLKDSDCFDGEYCNSLKAKIVRDVKRLEDLAEINTALKNYKNSQGIYPNLNSGSYLSGLSLSVWPSWQRNLGTELKTILPLDPINKLGNCPGFDEITCWDEKNQKFATDLNQKALPPGSHVYLYLSSPTGDRAGFCAQMESGFQNLSSLHCSFDIKANNPPIIKEVQLSGIPGKPFSGFIWAEDIDGDNINLKIDLVNPSYNTWLSRGWSWYPDNNNFQIKPALSPGQFEIRAQTAGNYALAPDNYQIRVSIDDGRHLSNSNFIATYPINIGFGDSKLQNVSKNWTIGQNFSMSMSGLDVDGLPLEKLNVKDIYYNNKKITNSAWQAQGFSLNGLTLTARYNTRQQTGNYAVNVFANSKIDGEEIPATFLYQISNHAPVFQELITYLPDETLNCTKNNCLVVIYNGEQSQASIKIVARDADNHKINYQILENPQNLLSINKDTGIISGLEKLTTNGNLSKNYPVKVKISDDFCSNSKEEECAITYSFNIEMRPNCSQDNPVGMKQITASGPFKVSQSGTYLNTGLNLNNCQNIISNEVNIKFTGVEEEINRNQAIVILSDISGSMATNVKINGENLPAITRLKSALADPNGLIENIYETAVNRKELGYYIKVLAKYYSYRADTHYFPRGLLNILSPWADGKSYKDEIKDIIYRYYNADGPTNTLDALNTAERELDKITEDDVDKIVILISDGEPIIPKRTTKWDCRSSRRFYCDCVHDTYPECRTSVSRDLETCPYKKDGIYYKYDWRCNTCYELDCGDLNILEDVNTGEGRCQYLPPTSPYSFNNNFKKYFSSFFNINKAKAITELTTCADVLIDNKAEEEAICPADTDEWDYFIDQVPAGENPKCDSSSDVTRQANAMKAEGITIYTIYYNTTNTDQPKKNMCNWSSNNGVNCDNNAYFFSGSDINEMMKKLASNLKMNKPKNVEVNNKEVSDPQPAELISFDNVHLEGITCGPVNPLITYENKGTLEFSNLKINYCPSKTRE